MPSIVEEHQTWEDVDGAPLVNAKIYVGVQNQDPVANPVLIYSDRALTTPIDNPQTTNAYGRAVNKIYTAAEYSLQVNDSAGNQVYSSLDAGGYADSDNITYTPASGVDTNVQAKLRESLSVADYGATGDGTTDDRAAIQSALNAANSAGGGIVKAINGLSYDCVITTSVTNKGLIIPDNVIFDLNGATLKLDCTGDVYGVRLKNNAWIINGIIDVDASATPGTQGIWHAPIGIGPANGEGGTVASPSEFEGVKGWGIYNIKVASVRPGAVGVQGYGGINHGLIDHLSCDDSSTLAGLVGFDWGHLGTISSSDIPTSRTNFDAGNAYTTHPHNIDIRNLRAGKLTRNAGEGSRCVRLSGVYDIRVDGFEVEETNYAGVYIHAGDLGFEFAPVAEKPFRHQGIRISNGTIRDAQNGWGVFCDMFADNIQAEIDSPGYSNLLPPIQRSDIEISNVKTHSDGGASVVPGFRIQKIIGCKLINCSAEGHKNGVLIEEGGDRITIIGGSYTNNREDGIYAGHGTDLPEDVEIVGVHTGSNGTDAGYANPAGIHLAQITRGKVVRCELSDQADTVQFRGLSLGASSTGITAKDNHCEDLDTGGQGYVVGTSTAYTILDEFSNNTVGAGVPNFIAGANIIPYRSVITPNGSKVRYSTSLRASLTANRTPTAGAWIVGDTIEYADPIAADYKGTVCTVAGSPGTWNFYGATI